MSLTRDTGLRDTGQKVPEPVEGLSRVSNSSVSILSLLTQQETWEAFLARAHLVHQFFCWDAEAFALSDFGGQGEIVFPFYEDIGLIELMPAEAAFHEAIGKKLFPGLLSGQLRDDTFHDKKEKGERF